MKNFIITILLISLVGTILSGCEKDNNANLTDLKSTSINTIASNIKIIDGMLSFDTWSQYESTTMLLSELCEKHVATYMDSIIKILGTDDENAINDQVEKDDFSQFKPLHDFAEELHFQSLFNLLENSEKTWMNDENSSMEDNPFNDICVERYQTALYNEFGEIMINGIVYNVKADRFPCKQIGSNKGDTDIFQYGGRKRLVHGHLSTTTLSIAASTTLYNILDSGKKSLWFSKIGVMVEGSKRGNCTDMSANSDFHASSRELPWGCFVSTISFRGTGPTYIAPDNHIHGKYEAVKANKSLDVYL